MCVCIYRIPLPACADSPTLLLSTPEAPVRLTCTLGVTPVLVARPYTDSSRSQGALPAIPVTLLGLQKAPGLRNPQLLLWIWRHLDQSWCSAHLWAVAWGWGQLLLYDRAQHCFDSDIGRWGQGTKSLLVFNFFFPAQKGGSNICRELEKDTRLWCQVVCLLLVGAHRVLSGLIEPSAVLRNASSLLEPVTLRVNVHRALSSLLESQHMELSWAEPRPLGLSRPNQGYVEQY